MAGLVVAVILISLIFFVGLIFGAAIIWVIGASDRRRGPGHYRGGRS